MYGMYAMNTCRKCMAAYIHVHTWVRKKSSTKSQMPVCVRAQICRRGMAGSAQRSVTMHNNGFY